MTERVRKILSNYESDNPGTKANLARILMQGRLGGTGKLVILPVDQGFEHGPARSFAPNPAAYDPHYHFELAIDAGLSAYAAPLGMIEAGANTFAGQIPTILKVNSSNSLATRQGPGGHRIGAGRAAPRLRRDRLHDLSGLGRAVRDDGRTARTDRGGQGRRPRRRGLVLPARRRALQGRRDRDRHLRLCRAHGGAAGRPHHQGEAADRLSRAVGREEGLRGPEDRRRHDGRARIKHVVQACFDGRRIVVFSGGEAKDLDGLYNEIRGIRDGGGNGSIIGRNTFQRPKAEALQMLDQIIGIYKDGA